MDHASCLTVLVLDHRPQYLDTSHSSMLTMPIGGASLLQYIGSQISRSLGANSLTLVPTFEITEEFLKATRQIMPGVCIQDAEEASERLGDLEPSDWVLIVDPAMWPADGLDLIRMGGEIRDARVATHLITLASEPGLTGERIQLDASNRIRRIQRSYFGITDLRSSGVVASIIPVSALRSLSGSLQLEPVELRGRMSASGLPIRDITAPGIALNLRDKVQMLNFNKLVLKQKIPHFPPWGQSENSNDGVFREHGVTVHGTARLIGPVVLRENCKIGAGAVLLGPVVVGRNANVGSKAVVANTILDHGTQVGANAVFCDQIAGEKLEHALSLERNSSNPDMNLSHGAPDHYPSDEKTPAGSQSSRVQMAVKRALDIALASIGLALVSPLLFVTAILIKLTSRGPVLFGHIREGLNGREFRCLKFRTMVPDAHTKQRELYQQSAVDGPQFKVPNDPRVTWLGGWLRSTNVDELPQLINVLCGHMSLIGPRPSPFRENQVCIPWRKARLSIRPGITGLWQVCRHERDVGDFHQWIHYDTLYVRRWSLWLDLSILIATVLTLGGRFSIPVHWLIRQSRQNGDESRPDFEFELSNRRDWLDLCLPKYTSDGNNGFTVESIRSDDNGGPTNGSQNKINSLDKIGIQARLS